jgi:hypothetical protein
MNEKFSNIKTCLFSSRNVIANIGLTIKNYFPIALLEPQSGDFRCVDIQAGHIDYLREFVNPVSVWYCHSKRRLEHRWAAALAKIKDFEAVPGFGCSDCKCHAHLFSAPGSPI